MHLHPIIAALVRHKSRAMLITLQIAITLAIVSNALFIFSYHTQRLDRSTGIAENRILFVGTEHTGLKTDTAAEKSTVEASIRADLAALRQLPSVEDAYETNSISISNINRGVGLSLQPNSRPNARATFFNADNHALSTLGIRLVAGRNFNSDEVSAQGQFDNISPAVTIVSKALADKLFPAGDALGKQVYFTSATQPSTIIGIMETLQGSSSYAWSDGSTWNSVLIPSLMVEASRYYVVRGKNGASDALKKDVASALYAQDPQRVLSGGMGTTSISNFAEIRRAAYRDDRGVMMMMAAVCVILLSVTTAGIVGLTSFWVSQRRKQIGVRRAFGATRADIAGYFLLENAFVSAVGVVLGAGLAFALNNYLMKEFELARMAVGNVLVGAAVLMLIGQMAALAPALGATRVSPSEVIR